MGFFSNLFGKKAEVREFDLGQYASFRRDCWIPVCEDGETEATASKFSGIAYLPEGESWPVCPNCNNPMQLFVQLNSDSLPEPAREIWGGGLLQFFYCTNSKPCCEVDCKAWDPFSRSTVLRIVRTDGPTTWSRDSPVKNAFRAKTIVGWEEKVEYPNWEEASEISGDRDNLSYADWEAVQEDYLYAGEKLLGWPCWVQGVEYPDCPECGTRMQLVFQIDSFVNVPYMFGDAGCGHITQCPEHKTQLAFRWACC